MFIFLQMRLNKHNDLYVMLFSKIDTPDLNLELNTIETEEDVWCVSVAKPGIFASFFEGTQFTHVYVIAAFYYKTCTCRMRNTRTLQGAFDADFKIALYFTPYKSIMQDCLVQFVKSPIQIHPESKVVLSENTYNIPLGSVIAADASDAFDVYSSNQGLCVDGDAVENTYVIARKDNNARATVSIDEIHATPAVEIGYMASMFKSAKEWLTKDW